MKAIVLLSLAALSLQGIIMRPYDPFAITQPTNGIINQRPYDPVLPPVDSNVINQRPMNDDVVQRPPIAYPIKNNDIINQRPIYTQPMQPIVNQTPMVNQIPVVQRPMFERHEYPMGYVQPSVINVQQPIYPQPISTIGMVNPTAIPVVSSTTIPIVPITTPINQNLCRIDGQYGQLCVRSNIFLTQDQLTKYPYRRRYKCLKKAICTFKDNKCQWLQTREFKRCIRRLMNGSDMMNNDYDSRRTFLGA